MKREIYIYEDVSNYFKQYGCELLEKHFINASKPIQYKCTCGGIFTTTFNRYKKSQHKKCRKCAKQITAFYTRSNIDDIKQYFRSQNCELLETEYVNNRAKMKYRCKCGNIDYKAWENFKTGQRCKSCAAIKKSEKLRTNPEDVYSYYKQNGCSLIEENYINNHSKLPFLCHCNRIEYDYNYRQFKEFKECRNCSNASFYDKEKVIRVFKENGCTVILNEYINNQQEVEYICVCGKTQKTIIHNYIQSTHKRCKSCTYILIGQKQAHNFDFVKKYFKENGCELLSTKYINNSIPLDYICKCGNTSKINFNSFYNGGRCLECGITRGENHPLWNSNLTLEEREKKRRFPEYRIWRLNVYERDNFICQCCGYDKGGILVAHHLDGWNWNKIDRFNVDNGITLCSLCHDDFHLMYGYGDNTKEQFEDFMAEMFSVN